jgi:hypothetical protein
VQSAVIGLPRLFETYVCSGLIMASGGAQPADLLRAIEGPSGQAMLATQFALVMGQVGIDRCGPPVSVVDPSLPSTHPPKSPLPGSAAVAFGHSVLCDPSACLLPPEGTV